MAEPENIVIAGRGVVPHVAVSDGAGAVEFYQKAFAAVVHAQMPAQDGKRLMHAALMINGGPLILNDFFPEHGHTVTKPQAIVLHLQVDDAQAWWDRAMAAGCTVVMPLEKMFWGDLYGHLVDPFGVTWSIAQTVG